MSEDALKYVPEKPYHADPKRIVVGPTAIFVRAVDGEGKWHSADIVTLDRDSLIRWLRSRGGKNLLAENVVLVLLGHEPVTD